MKKIIISLALGLVISQAMAADLSDPNSCKSFIYNHGASWVTHSYTSQLPGDLINMSMSFNSDVSEMTVQDSVDPESLTIPVTVTCINATEFSLKDSLPQDAIGHMSFTGVMINNAETNTSGLVFVGTKTMQGDPNIYSIAGTPVQV